MPDRPSIILPSPSAADRTDARAFAALVQEAHALLTPVPLAVRAQIRLNKLGLDDEEGARVTVVPRNEAYTPTGHERAFMERTRLALEPLRTAMMRMMPQPEDAAGLTASMLTWSVLIESAHKRPAVRIDVEAQTVRGRLLADRLALLFMACRDMAHPLNVQPPKPAPRGLTWQVDVTAKAGRSEAGRTLFLKVADAETALRIATRRALLTFAVSQPPPSSRINLRVRTLSSSYHDLPVPIRDCMASIAGDPVYASAKIVRGW